MTAFPGALPHARAAPGPRIVIAGGGLAGLTAAYRLRQAGYAAEVHDASSRLGGRCWTRRGGFVNDQLSERGGEFIDTGHREIRRLIRELGLALVNLLAAEQAGTEPLHYFDGQPYTDAQATQDYREVRPALRRDVNAAGYPTTYLSSTARGRELDRTSVAEYIEQVVPGGRGSRFGQLLELAYVTEYGAEAGDQSSLNLLYLLGFSSPQFEIFGESDQRFRIDGGNDRLVDALVQALSGQITRESELIAIERRSGGGYDLAFQQGLAVRSVRADRAILALPFSILRSSVDISRAGFKPRKRTAIREQGMGANAKLAAQFSERRWRTSAATARPSPTRATSPAGTRAGARQAGPASSSTTPAGRRRSASLATPTRWRVASPGRSIPCCRGSGPSTTVARRSTTGRAIPRPRAPTPTGRSASTRASPASRARSKTSATSPASTPRSTSRATSTAPCSRASAPPRRWWPPSAGDRLEAVTRREPFGRGAPVVRRKGSLGVGPTPLRDAARRPQQVGAARAVASEGDMLTATTTACPMKRSLGIGLAGASSEAVPPLWWPLGFSGRQHPDAPLWWPRLRDVA